MQAKDEKGIREELKARLQNMTTGLATPGNSVIITKTEEHHFGPGWKAIISAMDDDNMGELLQLIEEIPNSVNGRIRRGDTVLIHAIHSQKVEAVELLVLNGANFNQKDNFPQVDGGKAAWKHALSSPNHDLVLLTLQICINGNYQDMKDYLKQLKREEFVKILTCMHDYNLTAVQANALAKVSGEVWTWILQGVTANPVLPLEHIILITSELLDLDHQNTCHVMLMLMNKFDALQNEPSLAPQQQTTTTTTTSSLGLFSSKTPLEPLNSIKDFINDELQKNGIPSLKSFKEYEPGYIKGRQYGFHLGVEVYTGLPYVRDRHLSIQIKADKVCCSKCVNGKWLEMTKEDIARELLNKNSLISQIVSHQEAKPQVSHSL